MAKAQDSYTHRLGWKLLRGPIPDERELHHRCGNPGFDRLWMLVERDA